VVDYCELTGRMILSGASDGLIAVSSRTTGMTVRVVNDQQGEPVTGIDVQPSPVCTLLFILIYSACMEATLQMSVEILLWFYFAVENINNSTLICFHISICKLHRLSMLVRVSLKGHFISLIRRQFQRVVLK